MQRSVIDDRSSRWASKARAAVAMSLLVSLLPLGASPAQATTFANTSVSVASNVAGIHADGGFVLFGVSESGEGSTDLNGDGDTFDVVWHILDSSDGTVDNLGLATYQTSASVTAAFEDGTAAFVVSESAQGGTDLNGDGDSSDTVLHVWRGGSVTNLSIAVAITVESVTTLSAGALMTDVWETAQGADLDGDGLLVSTVPFTWRPGDSSPTSLGFHRNRETTADEGMFLFDIPETTDDWNGDLDMFDRIAHVWDSTTDTMINSGLAVASFAIGGIDDGQALVKVSELSQGNADLNTDGDAADTVAHLWDIGTGTISNLGVASSAASSRWAEGIGGGGFLFTVTEFSNGNADSNGDGDSSDEVLAVVSPGTSTVTNLAVAANDSTGATIEVVDGTALVTIGEADQGNTDLNGDGDSSDIVVHLWDGGTTITNLGVAPGPTNFFRPGMWVRNGLHAVAVSEDSQGNTDLNGDGDTLDHVMYAGAVGSGLANLGLEASLDSGNGNTGPAGIGTDFLAFIVNELKQGAGDINGDGSVGSNVLHTWDPISGTEMLSEPVGQRLAVRDSLIAIGFDETFANGGTDLNGDGDSNDLVLHYTAPIANQAPVANASGPYQVDEGSTVLLDGSASSDPDGTIVSYDWSPGTDLDDPSLAQPTFTGIDDAVVDMTLTVTDDDADSDTDTAVVTVNNVSPTVEAGTDQNADVGETVSLDPATFTDPGIADTHTATIDWDDGTVEAGTVDQVSGTVTGSHSYASAGTYTVTVTVTDDDGGSHSDTMTVSVEALPTLSITDAQVEETDANFFAQLIVTLSAPSSSDVSFDVAAVDGTAMSGTDYNRSSGRITIPAGSTLAVTGVEIVGDDIEEPTEDFTINISNPSGATISVSEATWTILDDDTPDPNTPPVANAGGPYQVDEGSAVLLDGTGSSDADGTVVSYDWSPGTDLDDPALAQPTFNGVDDAAIDMTLTVTDDAGDPDSDTTTITVNNVAPSADAGADQTADVGETVSLEPATFADPGTADTHTATIDWGDGTVESGTVDQGAGTVSGSHGYGSAGNYTVTVTVTDDDGGLGTDTLSVVVSVGANLPPVADAGGPYQVDEGSTVLLDGSASSDPDGTIVTYDWSPGTDLDDPSLAQPTFTGIDDAVVDMTLTVTDDDSDSDSVTTTVTVTNVAPNVEAGIGQSIGIGENVNLDPASFTDPGTADTHTSTIDWGDGTVEPGTVDQLAGTVSGSHSYSTAGTYTVTVTVTDDDGGTHSDALTVTVNSTTNQPPTAEDDQTVTPIDTAVIIDVLANDTDPDGDSLVVSNLSDPANDSALLDAEGTVTYTPDPGFVGTDTFMYTANDGQTESDPATVTVFVIPPSKLLASDGSAFDRFGYSVAISGDRIVVGAQTDTNDNGFASGSVYVYEPDGEGGWTESKITASDGAGNDRFGRSVAVSGDRIVVGAFQNDDDGVGSGSAYVFEPDGTGGWLEAKLTASDGGDYGSEWFGWSVAVSGERIVVSAYLDSNENGTNSGSAYLFEPDGAGGWAETKLTASDGSAFDRFGYSVAISGDRIVVGAAEDDGTGFNSGSVYVYESDGAGGWAETKLAALDGAAEDLFGWSVAISGDWIVVGAPFDDDNDADSGSVYVYESDGVGGWAATKLAALDSALGDSFGWSVAISGDRMVVGAYLDDDNGTSSGSAYVFELAPLPDNNPPTADDDTADTVVNVSMDIDVLANDSDPDGDALSLTNLSDPANGSTTANTNGTVTYTPDPGFAGVDTFTYTAFDEQAESNVATVTITVDDITAPVLDLPADIVTEATSPDGAVVDFTVTATDDSDLAPVVACVPAPGTLFPLGETTVECTATDESGNSSAGSFLVTVEVGPATFDGFAALVEDLELPGGTGRSILAKIDAAQAFFGAGDIDGAVSKLRDVIRFANAQYGKKLTPLETETIIEAASALIAAIQAQAEAASAAPPTLIPT